MKSFPITEALIQEVSPNIAKHTGYTFNATLFGFKTHMASILANSNPNLLDQLVSERKEVYNTDFIESHTMFAPNYEIVLSMRIEATDAKKKQLERQFTRAEYGKYKAEEIIQSCGEQIVEAEPEYISVVMHEYYNGLPTGYVFQWSSVINTTDETPDAAFIDRMLDVISNNTIKDFTTTSAKRILEDLQNSSKKDENAKIVMLKGVADMCVYVRNEITGKLAPLSSHTDRGKALVELPIT